MVQLFTPNDSPPAAAESSEQPIGFVIGRSSPQSFVFVSDEDTVPPRLEYVVIHGAREQVDDTFESVDLLAQVTGIRAEVLTLGEDLDYAEAQTVVSQNATLPPRVQAEATVLGYLQDGVVRQARMMVLPGTPVHTAPDSLLRAFFSRDEASSITLGTLINRRGVDVRLDPNGLSRHLAIIAQTGAGKSYLAGKLLEDLLGLGATIVVLDPNSDYVQLRKTQAERRPAVSPRDQDATRRPDCHSPCARHRGAPVPRRARWPHGGIHDPVCRAGRRRHRRRCRRARHGDAHPRRDHAIGSASAPWER